MRRYYVGMTRAKNSTVYTYEWQLLQPYKR